MIAYGWSTLAQFAISGLAVGCIYGLVGIGFVLYLVYAELFTIGSICLYCTSVHVITFLLFVLTAFAAAAWGLKPGAPWKLVPDRQPE